MIIECTEHDTARVTVESNGSDGMHAALSF